jgi:hypothetical protein
MNGTDRRQMSMSTINQQELIASFKLLVQMAKADGKIQPEEIESLQESFGQVALPEGITIDGLLAEELDTQLCWRRSPVIRRGSWCISRCLPWQTLTGGQS